MRLTLSRRTVEGFLRNRRQFSQASRGRKLIRNWPICRYRGRFLSLEYGLRLDSKCPGCHSRECHRLLHLFLTEDGRSKLDGQRGLHFAPERLMLARMQADPLYVSADLHQPGASQRINATVIPYLDDAFDVLIAYHILEHIPDDRAALQDFARVLRSGGVPVKSLSSRRTRKSPVSLHPSQRSNSSPSTMCEVLAQIVAIARYERPDVGKSQCPG